jgi:hypothetical protein
MNRTSIIAGLMAVFATLLVAGNLYAAENIVTPAMTGHWDGNARIIVSWCHQTNLPVAVDIHADGSVTGKIGDATLVAGHFLPHRTWPWGHTMVTGKLDGAIVAAEGITRSSVTMICDFSNGSFQGQIDTNGYLCVFSSEKTRKEKMALTAIGLKLIRSQSRP